MTQSSEDCFNVELLKLLLQVAWSDHRLDPREMQTLLAMGRSWMVPEPELQALKLQMEHGKPLPSPNLSLLKPRLDEVLEAARALCASDSELAADEKEMLEQLKALLGGS